MRSSQKTIMSIINNSFQNLPILEDGEIGLHFKHSNAEPFTGTILLGFKIEEYVPQ